MLKANPFRMPHKAALINDPHGSRLAGLFVPGIGDVIHPDPFRLRLSMASCTPKTTTPPHRNPARGRCVSQSGRPDSNRRRPAWEAGILPTELRPRGAAPASCYTTTLRTVPPEPQIGIEPMTARLRIGCSTTELLWHFPPAAPGEATATRMPWRGLEPRRLSAPPPQDGVSTNFTTRARGPVEPTETCDTPTRAWILPSTCVPL